MPVRLKDIAQELGVSTVTVSKVLRGNADIGAATRERVLKRMQELDYRPNMLARGLAGGRSYAVGLVVPDLVHPFFAEFAKSLAAVLRTHHLAFLLASSEENPELELEEVRTLIRRGVDVLVLASCSRTLPKLTEAETSGVPVLLVDRRFPRMRTSFVGSDDVLAGKLAVEHLVATGRRRIAHIAGLETSPARDRLQGFRQTMQTAGLSVPDTYVIRKERLEESGDLAGCEAMQQLLRQQQRPDAVFCYNDMSAVGSIDAVLAAGLRVPEDVAVIGCGNLRYAAYLRVPLSSVDQGTAALGHAAGELAWRLSQKNGANLRETIVLPPHVIARASTSDLT